VKLTMRHVIHQVPIEIFIEGAGLDPSRAFEILDHAFQKCMPAWKEVRLQLKVKKAAHPTQTRSPSSQPQSAANQHLGASCNGV